MEKNHKSIDSYFESARKFKTPISQDYARNLIGGRRKIDTINKSFFTNKGIKIMTTISALTAVALFLLFNNFEADKSEPESILNKNTSNSIEMPVNETVTDIAILPDTSQTEVIPNHQANEKVESNQYNIEDLTWDLVRFRQEDWSFERIVFLERTHFKTAQGNEATKIVSRTEVFDDKYLIKVAKQLEDSLSKIMDINRIKSLSGLEISDYFNALVKLADGYLDYNNSDMIGKMIDLYAHINRKFLNNPGSLIGIKSRGLILPKETLEKLGIEISDSTISIPYDSYFKNYPYQNKYIELFQSDRTDLIDLPENEFILKKNIVYEWESFKPKYDNEGNVNWRRSNFARWHRESFESVLPNHFNDPNRIWSLNYYSVLGIENSSKWRKTSPIIFEENFPQIYHNAILYNANADSRKLYDFMVMKTLEMYEQDKKDNTMSDLEKSVFRKRQEMLNLIFDNMTTAFKIKYLVPVDVQIPYYGFSKEELNERENYSAIKLWYYPNEEFLSAIPDDIRKQLELELRLIDEMTKGEIQPEEACNAIENKESLLDLCNINVSTLSNLSVYPNPANDFVNVEFDISKQRHIKIVLFDTNGKYIKDLTDWDLKEQGKANYFVNLSGIKTGTYVLQVISEKGERLLYKLAII